MAKYNSVSVHQKTLQIFAAEIFKSKKWNVTWNNGRYLPLKKHTAFEIVLYYRENVSVLYIMDMTVSPRLPQEYKKFNQTL